MEDKLRNTRTSAFILIGILLLIIGAPKIASTLGGSKTVSISVAADRAAHPAEKAYERCVKAKSSVSSYRAMIEKSCGYIKSACAADLKGFQCQNYLSMSFEAFLDD